MRKRLILKQAREHVLIVVGCFAYELLAVLHISVLDIWGIQTCAGQTLDHCGT